MNNRVDATNIPKIYKLLRNYIKNADAIPEKPIANDDKDYETTTSANVNITYVIDYSGKMLQFQPLSASEDATRHCGETSDL